MKKKIRINFLKLIIFSECDCDIDGTTDEGECDQYNDEEEGLIAGQCHCKTNVDGQRCDRCKNGFWNFTMENWDGCQGLFLRLSSFSKKVIPATGPRCPTLEFSGVIY